jgi:hypothetical protein
VHKLSTYIHIYKNRKRKRKKEKGFSVNWARGDFGPASALARAATWAAGLTRPASGERCGDGAVGAGPCASEGGGNDVSGEMGVRLGGKTGHRSSTAVLRR